MSNNENQYTKNEIEFYSIQEGIRSKTHMYLSASKPSDIAYKAIQEIYLNSLDEFNVDPFKQVELYMYYDTNTRVYKNIDTGRGIPIDDDIIEKIITTLHSGSKLDKKKNKSYGSGAAGSNGSGTCIVNCISEYYIVRSVREGKIKTVTCNDGVVIDSKIEDLNKAKLPKELASIPNFTHGTMVELRLSDKTLEDTSLEIPLFIESCEWMAYGSNGFRIHLQIDNKKYNFYSQNGYIDLLEKTVKEKHLKPVINPIQFFFEGNDNDTYDNYTNCTVLLSFNSTTSENIHSFVNGLKTFENGSHVTGIKSGISQAFNQYMKDNDKIPKKYEKMEVSGSIINDFIITVIAVKTDVNLMYSDQSKSQVRDTTLQGWLKSKFYNAFLTWLNNNPKDADKLIKIILLESEARYAASQAKNKVLGIETNKTNFLNSSISKRLEDCLSKNPEESEVFIVEGESASVGSIRDSKFQAYYLLRGKIFNVIKSDKLENDVLLDFINMLGCGFGNKKDIKKLRYGKIIVLADADTDGLHIGALVLGFFYKYYPELIINGNVYIGNPPLYTIEMKSGRKIFVKNQEHFNFIIVEIMKHKFNLISNKSNKIITDKLYEGFLYGLRNYAKILENHSKQQNVTPELLESIILYYKDIQKNSFEIFKKLGYNVKIQYQDEYKKILVFDEDIHHYNLVFDKNFYDKVYLPLFNKISNEIGLYNVRLESKEDNTCVLNNTLYGISQLMDSLFEGKNIKNFRLNKGLGEMTPEDLDVSVINPKTRMITQVTMKDAEKAAKIIETFLGTGFPELKKAYFEED